MSYTCIRHKNSIIDCISLHKMLISILYTVQDNYNYSIPITTLKKCWNRTRVIIKWYNHLYFCSINLLDRIYCRKCFFTQRFRSWIYSHLQVRVLSLEWQFFLFYYYSSLCRDRDSNPQTFSFVSSLDY